MVFVTNAGNKELFQDCVMLNILRKYFPLNYHPAATSLPENPCAYGLLKRLCGELENGGCAVTALPALNRNMESEMTAGSRNEHRTGNVDTNTATASGIFFRRSKGWSSHSGTVTGLPEVWHFRLLFMLSKGIWTAERILCSNSISDFFRCLCRYSTTI